MHTHNTMTGRIISRSMYGIIISMALLLTMEQYTTDPWKIAIGLVTTLLSVSIAEAYTESIGTHIDKQRPLYEEERHHIIQESLYVFSGSTLPVLSFVFAGVGILDLPNAFLIAKTSAVVILFEYGYLYGRRSGRTRLSSLKVGGLNVVLVLLIILFKEFIHI